ISLLFTVGGTLSLIIHKLTDPTTSYECFLFFFTALIFAIKEINADPALLPNVTLGFQVFDTCLALRKAIQATLQMMSGRGEITPNYHCRKESPLAGIIGDSESTGSILMAQILGLNRFPQVSISYFATNPMLSDRGLFPSFLRTIPSDEFQMKGLAQLVLHFGWSWVGLLASDNDYGQYGLQMVKQEIINGGACVAFSENIITGQPNRNAQYLAQVITKSTANVVVVVTSDVDFVIVLEELLRQNVTGITWVASEAWATSDLLSGERFRKILSGTIGLAIHSGTMPEFSKYLNSLHPASHLHDLFIREFWEKTFSCTWPSQETLVTRLNSSTLPACTGNEKLEGLATEEGHRVSLNIYTAVYAIALGLQNLLDCKPGTGPFADGSCADISTFQPWQLLHYIKNINFKNKDQNPIFFDAKGNPPAVYDFVNWRLGTKGTLKQATVASYDLSGPDWKTFNVDTSGIIWANRNTQVPLSKCSPSCSPGFRQMIVPEKPPCCYECARCPQGQISNQTDAVECHPCSWDTWPDPNRIKCVPKTTEFLFYEGPLGYGLTSTAMISSPVPLFILGIFICYKKTPIVRANNYSLSCLLLLSLFLCFLCSLGFIGYPQPEKCLLRQVAFGMVFALCISCVLAKTITVVIAFNATKPGNRLRKWTGVRVSYCVIGICVLIQLFLCVIWLILSPPFPEYDTGTKPGIIIVVCNEGSPTAFWCMLGYLGFLAMISFIVAFLARRLPDSFNEAKLITFSMLAFLSVWVSFIPAYLSARGMYTVAMEVFAILSSSWAVVGCIFVPKCYIVLFKPNVNSRKHILGKRGPM
uniref:G-protein coupled receptors family 3 profile domain-containing protein n=1 Tax=Xenopus tropicalis TaxID=8364 RepID=A0A6I8QZA7_XENTR